MKLSVLTATLLLCTSGCGEQNQLLHQRMSVKTSNEITTILVAESWSVDYTNNAVYEQYSDYDQPQDTLPLSHYVFDEYTTPEAKKLITDVLVSLKLGSLQRKIAEDGSALVFYAEWKEKFAFFPNIEYWRDDQHKFIMISKIADMDRDEIMIGLSRKQISNAHIDHCLPNGYNESENYFTQLPHYSSRDIENLLMQLRWGRSVAYKQ